MPQSIPLGPSYAVWIIFSLFLSQTYAQLDESPGLLVLLICCVLYLAFSSHLKNRTLSIKITPAALSPSSIAVALILTSPLFVYLVMSWGWGTPYGGDFLTHVAQNFRVNAFWVDPLAAEAPRSGGQLREIAARYIENPSLILYSRIFAILLVSSLGLLIFRVYGWRALAIFLLASMMILAFIDQSSNYRWPPLGYMFSALPSAVALLMDWSDLGNALRLSNSFAVFFWLLILRPMCTGQRPSWKLLPFFSIFFLTPPSIFLFSSAYIESWAIIFILTALERAMRHGSSGFPLSALLIGVATLIKEPAIVALPFSYLLARLKNPVTEAKFFSKQTITNFWASDALLLGCAALPFICFFTVRHALGPALAGTNPAIEVRSWHPGLEHLSSELIVGFLANLKMTLHPVGGPLLALIASAWIYVFLTQRSVRPTLLICALGVVTFFSFFLIDPASAGHLSYYRFFIWPLLFATLPALLLFDSSENKKRSPGFADLPLIILVGWIISASLSLSFSRVSSDPWDSNFTFYKQEPIFLADDALIRKYAGAGNTVSHVIEANEPAPGLSRNRYSLSRSAVRFTATGFEECACSTLKPVVMFLRLRKHHQLPTSWGGESVLGTDEVSDDLISACSEKLKNSCAQIFQVFDDAELIGVLGVLKTADSP